MKEILIIPVGLEKPERLDFLRRGIEKSYAVPCRIGEGISLPRQAYNRERRQYLSTAILNRLEGVSGGEGTVKIGVADVDLYVPDLNFVFGEARLEGDVCVISLYRLGQDTYCLPPRVPAGQGREAEGLFERRALTEAVHELGHTLGLEHCSNPRCVMFFSNSLVDTDRKGYELCGRCRAKLGIDR